MTGGYNLLGDTDSTELFDSTVGYWSGILGNLKTGNFLGILATGNSSVKRVLLAQVV